MSRSDDMWGDRYERSSQSAAAHPFAFVVKAMLVLAVLILVGGVIFGAASWIGGWGSEAARVTGAQNTREQTTAVLDDEQAMIAAAGNACDAKSSSSNDGTDPTLVEKPDFAYRAQYRRIKADYDRRMNNLFEAAFTRHIPLPDTLHGLPRYAPSLREREAQVC